MADANAYLTCGEVDYAMAFVEQYDRRDTRRRIVSELVTDLRDNVGPRPLSGSGHDIQEQTIIQTEISIHITTVNQYVFALEQLINPPM